MTAAHQQVTRDWWQTARNYYELHISELVLAEISAGNPGLASARLELVAVSYEIDYLVTWNCAHIANGEVIRRLMRATTELSRFCPAILTPNELMGSTGGGVL